MLTRRIRAKRERRAADLCQRLPENPLDEVFEKDAKRIRRRRGWSVAVEVAAAVLDALP